MDFYQNMLLILPTDTCYGLAGELSTTDYDAIYALKGRDQNKRLAICVADFAMLEQYATLSSDELDYLRHYPRPWSVILPRKHDTDLPSMLQGEAYREIAFRVGSVCLREYDTIAERMKFPIFLTSANRSSENEAHTFAEAREYFPHIDGIDGGECNTAPSDIFSFDANGKVRYVRKNFG